MCFVAKPKILKGNQEFWKESKTKFWSETKMSNIEGNQNKSFRRTWKNKFWIETKNFRRKPKISGGNQKVQKETIIFGKKPKILNGKQEGKRNNIFEGKQRNWKESQILLGHYRCNEIKTIFFITQ